MLNKCLAIVIIMLMLGVITNNAFNADKVIKADSSAVIDGNTLYVGGIGPGNYTTIQSAIDDALDDDTIYVYDYSSPYIENIVIETA